MSHLPHLPQPTRADTPSQPTRFGCLALAYAGKYIGTRDAEGPVSRETNQYFRSEAAAQQALARGGWSQLPTP
ncbi:hypothetical protein LL962_05035 [Xanthomonas sp. NCPPB 1067]|uniref:hypothetical protein n=1 Tax=Xanthomonas sp. NCPPB 1067 TaxID=487524 RepID=UPI001E631E07|nr:hypothetical protein [Xanthomonas sp. NCPPB 1067]MCC4586478.1 hypothetical protein [Xanthomonas sp. NCPPB 1067]